MLNFIYYNIYNLNYANSNYRKCYFFIEIGNLLSYLHSVIVKVEKEDYFMDRKLIVIDPGHGGTDPGAVYESRQEKDDVLNLALVVGEILKNNGIDVVYTRVDDTNHTPWERANIANKAEGDYFLSLHRGLAPNPETEQGVEISLYSNSGTKADMANAMEQNLSNIGFVNRGIKERKDKTVLKNTKMPAILLDVGVINHTEDNKRFDQYFDEIASGIAEGILQYIEGEEGNKNTGIYRVQTGAFRNLNYANEQLNHLLSQNLPAYIIYEHGLYKVQVGGFDEMQEAIELEQYLRSLGYSTFITK